MTELLTALAAEFPDVIDAESPDASGPMVPIDKHFAFATFLKAQGFTRYVTVVGSHWPAKTEEDVAEYEVATVLRKLGTPSGTFTWRVRFPMTAEIPTLYPLFAGADLQEREQFDLVGVRFENHPDLRRLMMPEDWEGHPLHKDYAIDTPHSPWR